MNDQDKNDPSAGLFDADQIYHTEILPKLQQVIDLCKLHGLPYHVMVCFKHTHIPDGKGDFDCQHLTDSFSDTKDERASVQMQVASYAGDASDGKSELVLSMLGAAEAMLDQMQQQMSARFN